MSYLHRNVTYLNFIIEQVILALMREGIEESNWNHETSFFREIDISFDLIR